MRTGTLHFILHPRKIGNYRIAFYIHTFDRLICMMIIRKMRCTDFHHFASFFVTQKGVLSHIIL